MSVVSCVFAVNIPTKLEEKEKKIITKNEIKKNHFFFKSPQLDLIISF